MPLTIRPITLAEIDTFVRWRYAPPDDVYNMLQKSGSDGDYHDTIAYFALPEMNCCAILSAEKLVGFCTFGADGRVRGGDYSQPALDIGMGMKPELTGQKRGDSFVSAVIDYAARTFAPSTLRVTIAAGNGRAQRVWQKAGFVQQERFASLRDDKPFFILVRKQI